MVMSTLGSRIKLRRVELGLNQTELANLLHTDQKQISKYENDKQEPTAGVLLNLARELETTADWLLGLTELVERPLRGEGDLDDEEVKLIEIYRAKNPRERQKMMEIARVV